MASMQDIADMVGISKGAVSLVLSGKAGRRVSDETKANVFKAARALNYRVNEVARTLRTGQSRIISVIVTDISNEFFGKMVFHIQEEAKKHGYLVLTANSNESAEEFDGIVNMLLGKQVDGIISVTPPGGAATMNRIVDLGIPLVQVDRLCGGLAADYVGVGNYGSTYDMICGLVKDSFKKIVMVSLDLDVNPVHERCSAYRDAMKANGLEKNIREVFIHYGETEGRDVSAASELVAGADSDADAVFFASRRAFTLTMDNIARMGYGSVKCRCLSCFDDVSSYLASSMEIRCVGQPIKEMACKAFSLLIEQLNGKKDYAQYIFNAQTMTNKI